MSITAALSVYARQQPSTVALRVDGDQLSWSQLDAIVHRLAAHLVDVVPSGQPVALHLPNSPAFVLLFLAAARAGREAQVLDPAWPEPLLDKVLIELSYPVLFTSKADLADRRHATHVDVAWDFESVGDALGAHRSDELVAEPSPSCSFYVGFTSGSTGMPKGYRRNHQSWLSGFVGDDAEFGVRPDDVVLAPGPMSHSLALYALVRGLNAGATVVFCRRFRPSHVLQLVAREGVTVLYGVPTQFRMLLDRSESLPAVSCDTVRLILSTGAKWPQEENGRLTRVFPLAEFCEFYGCSELGYLTLAKASEKIPARSVGRAFPDVVLTIRNRQGDVLAPGQIGLVFAKSAQMFSGYACGELGSLAIAGNAMSVGDVGLLDEGGFLYLEGRSNRMIICSGRNVHPEEIEDALMSHAMISGAAVFGASERERGERLVALLFLAGNQSLRRADVIGHLRPKLPLYKIPMHYGVVATWPITGLGKPDFAALRDSYDSGQFEELD